MIHGASAAKLRSVLRAPWGVLGGGLLALFERPERIPLAMHRHWTRAHYTIILRPFADRSLYAGSRTKKHCHHRAR